MGGRAVLEAVSKNGAVPPPLPALSISCRAGFYLMIDQIRWAAIWIQFRTKISDMYLAKWLRMLEYFLQKAVSLLDNLSVGWNSSYRMFWRFFVAISFVAVSLLSDLRCRSNSNLWVSSMLIHPPSAWPSVWNLITIGFDCYCVMYHWAFRQIRRSHMFKSYGSAAKKNCKI